MSIKKKAIIIDLDGTLVNNAKRVQGVDGSQTADWDAFNALSRFEPVNKWCVEIVERFQNDHTIVFLTARSGSAYVKKITEMWLDENMPATPYVLIMRHEDDRSQDFIFKEDAYKKQIEPFYDVLFAVDDKMVIAELWRKLRIPALHCESY